MRIRTWPVAAIGLTGLLGLIAVFGVTTARRASINDVRLGALYKHYRDVEVQLHRLRSDLYLSGIFIRDYLLETSPDQDAEYRQTLAAYRQSNRDAVATLRGLFPDQGDAREHTDILAASLEQYWKAFEPLFDRNPAGASGRSTAFLNRDVVPRREEVLNIAKDVEELNSASLEMENQEASRQSSEHLRDMQALLWQTLGLGALVTVVSVNRFRVQERRTAEQRALAENAEAQMRALSLELVATQEDERRKLSRELHDHVGQMLTGLRMELGRIERLGAGAPPLAPAIADSRSLVDQVMRTVRDLAMGLRPSMLDDFGLEPALEWLIRDFSRRSGVQATVTVSPHLTNLDDPQRTCVFRAVQEALTNCGRHSGASTATATVEGNATEVVVTVRDNGVGIAPGKRRAGLGLRGLEERARELNGTLAIETGFGTGTTLTMRLPIPSETEVRHAHSAG